MNRARTLTLTLAALLLAAGLTVPAAARPAAAETWTVPDSAAKQRTYLDIVADFMRHAETYWRGSDLEQPRTGYYDASGPGVTQPRGAGNVAIAAATLLTARPDQPQFGGVDRETLLDHTIQSIRHEAYTSELSGAGYDRWGGGEWQSALEAYSWALAAYLLWDQLDADTREVVRTVVVGEADILIDKPIASGEWGDTGAEDNGWNSPLPALAAVLFPDHPRRAQWETTAKKLAINASSVEADTTSDKVIDGHPLSWWNASVNLHPDFTMENHGFFNPIYQQVTHTNISHGAVVYGIAGHDRPEAFSFRTELIWERVLGRLATDDGDLAMVQGQDWVSKDYQHLGYLANLATRFGRADASVLEARAAATVRQRQQHHDDGSILGQAELGYESMLVMRMSYAWWLHELYGPAPTPTADEFRAARAATEGVQHHTYSRFVAGRFDDAFVSMSWDDQRPMGLVVPRDTDGEFDRGDAVFTYYRPGSLIGDASGAVGDYSCDCDGPGFATAGTIGQRRFALTAFADGLAIALDRGTGSTLTFSLEDIPGVTDDRAIETGAHGETTDWVNAGQRLGLAVVGGSGVDTVRHGGTSPHVTVRGSSGTGTGYRVGAFLPGVGVEDTARLAETAGRLDLPGGWAGMVIQAPDGTRRLAVARWGGPEHAATRLADPAGAPLVSEPGTVNGTTNRVELTRADNPSASGEVLRFFLRTDAPVQARIAGDGTAELSNPSAEPVRTTLTYLAEDGDTQEVERVLAPGERVRARFVAGRLTMAGPELEHLRAARSAAADLGGELERLHDAGEIPRSRYAKISGLLATVHGGTADAVDESMAVDPDTAHLAELVTEAERLAGKVRGEVAELPSGVAGALLPLAKKVERSLGRALGEVAAVTLRLEPATHARPGEPLTLRVTAANRGAGDAVGGTVRFDAPEGWAVQPVELFDSLPAGDAVVRDIEVAVAPSAEPGDEHRLVATLDYRRKGSQRTSAAATSVEIRPLLTVEVDPGELPLAVGGVNRTEVALTNHLDRPLEVSMAARPPDGVTATVEPSTLTLAPSGTVRATVELGNNEHTEGTGRVELTASSGARATTAAVTLLYSDNLAANPVGAPWPKAFADSHQAGYPPAFANDGEPSSFWVSAGTQRGDGPTPDHPIRLGVDLGAEMEIAAVTMVPRPNYGPRSYAVEVSADRESWQRVADVTDAPNESYRSEFEPVTARHVRLVITDSHDWARPPRNVQVAELQVHAP